MTSSILRSSPERRRFPPRLALAIGIAIGAWLLSAAYTLLGNPEVALFKHAAKVKLAWARELARQHTNRVLVFGGSSSTFSVDAGRAFRTNGVPLANLALGAGMGAKVLTRFAAAEARPGDTLLMMLEPGLLYADLDATQLGIQFSVAIGKPRLASTSDELFPGRDLPWRSYFAALRPGGYHFFTLLGKIVRGQPLYRYTPADFDESGHQQTSAKAALVTPRGRVTISSSAEQWLAQLKQWCEQRDIRLMYALPWAFCPEDQVAEFQNENAFFVRQMLEFMPVLYDSRLGAYSEEKHFADTSYHLNKEGAAVRTDELMRSLTDGRYWTRDGLPATP